MAAREVEQKTVHFAVNHTRHKHVDQRLLQQFDTVAAIHFDVATNVIGQEVHFRVHVVRDNPELELELQTQSEMFRAFQKEHKYET